ncbi:DUF945 family protein [Ostreibacterium oceani]|nr:DUF945 family protein [Ostreibacterium oceani]
MKKIGIIAVAGIIIIAAAAFLFKGKISDSVGNQFEKQAKTFLENNTNKPISIKSLAQSPEITTATITINEVKDTEIRSQLDISLAMGQKFSLPLNTEIQRGEISHNGKSYGFGKLVTKPDLSQFTDLPAVIDENTFTLEQFIDLLGNVHEVYTVTPLSFKDSGSQMNFAGATVNIDTSFFNRANASGDFAVRTLTVNEDNNTFILSPIEGSFNLSENGDYQVSTGPLSIEIAAIDGTGGIRAEKMISTGNYQSIDGLSVPLNNGEASIKDISIKVPDPMTGQMTEIKLSSLDFTGGIYQNGDNHVDIKYNVKANATENGIALPLPVLLQSASMDFQMNRLANSAINTYFDTLLPIMYQIENSANAEAEALAVLEGQLLPAIQQSDTQTMLAFDIQTDQGKAAMDADFALNESGKSASVNDLIAALKRGDTGIINANAKANIAKSLSDATELTSMLQLFMGEYVNETETDYTFEAVLKDGQATLNGKPLPL